MLCLPPYRRVLLQNWQKIGAFVGPLKVMYMGPNMRGTITEMIKMSIRNNLVCTYVHLYIRLLYGLTYRKAPTKL